MKKKRQSFVVLVVFFKHKQQVQASVHQKPASVARWVIDVQLRIKCECMTINYQSDELDLDRCTNLVAEF